MSIHSDEYIVISFLFSLQQLNITQDITVSICLSTFYRDIYEKEILQQLRKQTFGMN